MNSNRLIKKITEIITINSYSQERNRYFMKQEYKIKEVFDEKSKPLEEKLKDIFISFLIEKINK